MKFHYVQSEIINGDYSYESEVWAVEDIDTNSDSLNDSYKVL